MHCSQAGGAPHFIGIETWATAWWFMRAVARALLQKALLSFHIRADLGEKFATGALGQPSPCK